MRLTTLSVGLPALLQLDPGLLCSGSYVEMILYIYIYERMVLIMDIAKATDENLTSENWEFILVGITCLCS